ncbi:hypothetical protein L1987_53254 [Smallanthus sonchifolius]|uniref:Uncharacterized protein n=1 Tax=Smallanthus sonchifolius TaxID=185202 RepID=A0ACB9EW58_9ASTR|nr:hypothetical protein L1987_53254 [Smallanthus sonchifolius]
MIDISGVGGGGMMSSLQGPVVCPSVHRKQGGIHGVPVVNGSLTKAKTLRSGMWGFRGVYSHQVHVRGQPKSKTVTCTFSSSSNGNGSMSESFNENDSDYIVSSVVDAVEVKSGPDGFMIKMRDGRYLRCAHNNPQGDHLPDYSPHPAIVLKMEDGTGLLLPIIVLEMPSALLMAAIRNVQIARLTMYQVVQEMVDKMGYKVKLVRVTKRIHEAYFAQLYLTKVDDETECVSFDLRPSDAINIAVRCNNLTGRMGSLVLKPRSLILLGTCLLLLLRNATEMRPNGGISSLNFGPRGTGLNRRMDGLYIIDV